jgi:hypothetical protein
MDRSYSRRQEMAGYLIGGVCLLLSVVIAGGIALVVTHFVVKFW